MDSRKPSWASGPGGGAVVVSLAWGLLLITWGTGCNDPRISLDEFIALEQEARQASAPTTQPAAALEASEELINRQLGPYKIGPGDMLHVVLTQLQVDLPFPPVDVRVDRNGEIDLPAVGSLKVGGLELEDVEDKIHGAYVPKVYREAVVHVSILAAETTDVLVIGAAAQPGLVPLRRTERNLLYAIVGAGGASNLASGEVTLRRIRRPAEEVTLDLTAPVGLKEALALDPLEDGDIVSVRAATPNTVFVGGLVNAPQVQAYPQGVTMTVLQAIAASGGLRTDVTPREGTLIRRMPDGQDVHVKLNLDRIARAQDPNIALAAGDIFWVPDTLETWVQDWINRHIFLRAGATATFGANYNMTGMDYLNSRARERFGGGADQNQTLQDVFDPLGFLLPN